MAALMNKTIAARGSILHRPTMLRRHQNFRLSAFSSVSIGSNPVASEHMQQDQQSTSAKKADDKSRLLTIRFYRMLLRQCQSLAATSNKSEITSSKQDTSESIMLQPRVVTTSNSLYFRTSPPVVTRPFDLFRLFYILVERESAKATAGTSVSLPPSHPQATKRSYSSASYAAPSTSTPPPDVSIDDWFFEVTGGHMPVFRNQNVDDEMRNLLVNTCWTRPNELQSVVRDAFKTEYKRIDTPELHKWTLRAIQILQDQQDLWTRSSVAVTDRIRTIATCQSGKSLAALSKYKNRPSRRFTYKIRIENLTYDNVQLLGRSLSIEAIGEDGKTYEEPLIDSKMLDRPYVPSTVLRPGQVFEFVGNANLKTDRGIVKGCFHMSKILETSAKPGMEAMPIGDIIHADIAPLELTLCSK